MKVKIKKLHPDAVIPQKTFPSDFCYDCVAVSEEEIAPNVWKYGLGWAVQIERGPEPLFIRDKIVGDCYDMSGSPILLSLDLRPRSSIWRTGMVLSNATGTIDENYRGEVSAVFYHIMPELPRYKVGDRIGQIKIGLTFPIQFEVVETLDDTDRGTGGYGSTGH